MTIQTLTTSAPPLYLAFALPVAKTIRADSRDYGFDFNEDELGRELLAPLPASLSIQSSSEVNANELENALRYFIP